MLGLYLKQLMEAKKQVYEAMSRGDFNAVQILMEKYKDMEQKLQLPIYIRLSKMSSDEIKQLAEILIAKGISLDLNDKDLKNKIISMFIDENLIATYKESATELELMGFHVYGPREGNAEVSIFHTSSEKFREKITVSERVFKKLDLGAYSHFRWGINYGIMEGIDDNTKQWSKFEYDSYSIDDIDKIIGTMDSLQKVNGEFIDIASPEYHTLLKICQSHARPEQLETPFIINNLAELKGCISEQFCKHYDIQDGNIEKSMKESELIIKIWEDIPFYPSDEEAKKYSELRSELSKDTGYRFNIGFSLKELKDLEKELLVNPIANSRIASKMDSYISNMKWLHDQKIKKFIEKIKQIEGINALQFADANTYYNTPEKLYELLDKHKDKIIDIEVFSKLLECDSLDMLKEQASLKPFKKIFHGNEEIIQYLSRIKPRKEVIQQFCKTVFIKLDDVFVKNGFDSILKNEIIRNSDNSKGIDWFELLVKYRDKFDELIRVINADWREIETLRSVIHKAKEFSWDIYWQTEKSKKEYSEQLKIGSFPTLDDSFEFESDIQPLSEYLSETGKSK